MAVREPAPAPLEIKETMWSVWPTWESWTWNGYEGKDLQVEVYSKYPSVKLYLNNKLIDEQPTNEEHQFKATFNVPYAAGVLSAVGVMNGKDMETSVLKTSGDAAKIKLIADRKEIAANRQDLSFVTIEITDNSGNLQPNAENQLQFSIDGPGLIAGVDNGNCKDVASYAGNKRKAWHGRALVVVRSTQEEGDIKLTVSSQGLSDAVVMIKSKIK
jgi:beta-galactosidase